MLITNYSSIIKVLGRQFGGLTSPLVYRKPEVMRNFYAQVDSINSAQILRDSFPTGTNPPYSFVLGDKGALLSATTLLNGSGVVTSSAAMGINITSPLTGSGTITSAQLSLVVSLASALSGSGTITVANLVGVVSLASSLSGTGSLTAGLSLLTEMEAVLNGTSSVTASLRGTLSMDAAIYVNQSQATIDELVAGVWNALAVNYNETGSMGEIMNNMGAVSDPWGVTLPGTYTGDQAGAIVDRLETLIKQVKSLTAAQL